MLNKIDFKSRTLFSTLKKHMSSTIASKFTLYSACTENTHIKRVDFKSRIHFGTLRKRICHIYIYISMIDSRNRDSQKTYMPNEIDFRTRTLFGTHRKRICRMRLTTTLVLYSALTKGTCQVRLTTSLVLYSAQTQNAHV